MAIATPCQTSGAQFHTTISQNSVTVQVELPFDLVLTEDRAVMFEANLHNALEMVLTPHFNR